MLELKEINHYLNVIRNSVNKNAVGFLIIHFSLQPSNLAVEEAFSIDFIVKSGTPKFNGSAF